VAAANVTDHRLLKETLDSIVVRRPSPRRVYQNLLADKDYTDWLSRRIAKQYGYDAHIPQRVNARTKIPRRPGRRKARRWVVERTFGNINRARAILIRWSKEPENYEALLHIAAGILCFRRATRKRRWGY
jgi:putative transposase